MLTIKSYKIQIKDFLDNLKQTHLVNNWKMQIKTLHLLNITLINWALM